MKADTAQKHVFWPDDFSITDDALIRSTRIAGPNQITDVYLVALALRQGGCLVTFDRRVAWQAVKGATADIVVVPTT